MYKRQLLKIHLDDCSELLDSLCQLGITLLNELNDGSSVSREKFTFSQNYLEEAVVTDPHFTSYSRNEDLLDSVFRQYTQKHEGNDVTVKVDSLTGLDLEQTINAIPTPANTPLPNQNNATIDLLDNDIEDDKTDVNIKEEMNYHKWDLLTEPLKYRKGQTIDLQTPSYLTSLRNIRDEVDTIFTKVTKRGAENLQILITDQLSTISMILRNFSFSEINSRLIAKNRFWKRFLSDLLWSLFINPAEKFKFHRKCLNCKKDVMLTLTNTAHLLEIDSHVDLFFLLMLTLSFGEPKKLNGNSNQITYSEYSLNWGKYNAFSTDVLAKLLSLGYPNRTFLKSILLNSFDINDYKNVKDVEIAKVLINKYNGDDKGKLFNDLVSFLFSAIPFQQLSTNPIIFENIIPIVSQTMISLLELLKFFKTDDNKNKDSFQGRKNLPLLWLKSEENIALNLRRLNEFVNNVTINLEKFNLVYLKDFLPMLSSRCVQLLTELIKKSIELSSSETDKRTIYDELISITNLLPAESEFLAILSNPLIDFRLIDQMQRLYAVSYTHLDVYKRQDVESVRYIADKNCAFVKYRYPMNAEFAKECMSNQTLLLSSDPEWEQRKEGSGLLVKWANEDPDPEAQKREMQEKTQETLRTMVNLLQKHEEKQQQQQQRNIVIEEAGSDDTDRLFDRTVLDKLQLKMSKSKRNHSALRDRIHKIMNK